MWANEWRQVKCLYTHFWRQDDDKLGRKVHARCCWPERLACVPASRDSLGAVSEMRCDTASIAGTVMQTLSAIHTSQ